MSLVNVIIFLFAVSIALFLSKYITKTLSRISQKIKAFSLEKTNPKISLKNTGSELKPLINAYNNMIDELEESAQKLGIAADLASWAELWETLVREKAMQGSLNLDRKAFVIECVMRLRKLAAH